MLCIAWIMQLQDVHPSVRHTPVFCQIRTSTSENCHTTWYGKTRRCGYPMVKNVTICLAVSTECCCWHILITCCRNSASPRIRHQQCIVSLVRHLISSGDMCWELSEWHHMRIGRCQPGSRACSRRHNVLGLF